MFGLMKRRRQSGTTLNSQLKAPDFQSRAEALRVSAAKLVDDAAIHEEMLKKAIAILSEDVAKTQELITTVERWS